MNKLFFLLIPAALFTSCGSGEEKTEEETSTSDSTAVTGEYKAGDEVTEEGAMASNVFLDSMKTNDSIEVKLTGKINSVCQVKGCWMRVDINGQELMVKFKDYAFFVPKDATGKTATITGWAHNQTVSVQELKEYAEDDGKSKEEIDAITEPKTELTFEASGVLIK